MSARRRYLPSSAGDWAVLALLATAGLGVLLSPLPRRSLAGVLPLALGLALYWAAAHTPWVGRRIARYPAFTAVWWTLAWGGLALALLGLVGMVAKPTALLPQVQRALLALQARLGPLQGRLPDTFHPNIVAGALVQLLPIGAALVLVQGRRRRPTRVLLALAPTLGMAAVLVLTSSRAGYLGAAAGLVALGILSLRRRRYAALVAAAGMAAVAAAGLWRPAWMTWALSGNPALTLETRREVWRIALYMLRDFPLTGVGFGCFEPVMQAFYPPFLGGSAPHAHNLLLQVALDVGIPGLLAYLAVVVLALRAAVRASAASSREWAPLGAACAGALVGMLVHGLLDASSWGNKGAWLPWAIAGLAMALQEAEQEEREG